MDGGHALFYILFWIFKIQGSKSSPKPLSHGARLLQDLFADRGHSPLLRPVQHPDHAVQVKFGVVLSRIIDVDEVNQSIHLSLWLQMIWYDRKLTWNASDYGNITSLTLPADKIWTPDVVLFNRVKFTDSTENTKITLAADGECQWGPLGNYYSQCDIDIRWFPFDDQICELKFESPSYNVHKLNLTVMRANASLKHYYKSEQWDIIDCPATREENVFDSGTYATIIFRIHLRRKNLFYVFNLIMPCMLISILSVVVFLLPPESGERTQISVAILVSFTVYQLIVLDRLPASGENLPLLGVYFGCVMAMGIVITILSIASVNIYTRQPPIYTMPEWVKVWICGRLASFLRLHMNKVAEQSTQSRSGSTYLRRSDSEEKVQNGLRIKDPLTYYINMRTQLEIQRKLDKEKIEQWKFAALVIDRLFFYIFLVLFSIGTAALFIIPFVR